LFYFYSVVIIKIKEKKMSTLNYNPDKTSYFNSNKEWIKIIAEEGKKYKKWISIISGILERIK
jgi:hypothetical protein